MTQRTVTLPEVGLIAGTRAALGMGIGLLIADRLSNDQRKAAGWAYSRSERSPRSPCSPKF